MIIKTYQSSVEASKLYFNYIDTKKIYSKSSMIHKVATTEKNSLVGRFYWRFADDIDIKDGLLDISLLSKPRFGEDRICQLNSDKKLIKIWKNGTNVSKYYKKHKTFIPDIIEKNAFYDNSFWVYMSDYVEKYEFQLIKERI